MVFTNTIAASVAGKVAQQTTLKVNVTLKIRNNKDHRLLPIRGQVTHLDAGVGTMTLNSVKSNLKNWLIIVIIYSSLVTLLITILSVVTIALTYVIIHLMKC